MAVLVRKRMTGGLLTIPDTQITPAFDTMGQDTDIVLEAQVNDWIEYTVSGCWVNDANTGYLDVAVINRVVTPDPDINTPPSYDPDTGAEIPAPDTGPEVINDTVVRYMSSEAASPFATGIIGLLGGPGVIQPMSGVIFLRLKATDIQDGQVRLRLVGAVFNGADQKRIYATGTAPLLLAARNLSR